MINDKIFLVLWVWYFLLLFIAFYRFVYRIVQICSAKVRWVLLLNLYISSYIFYRFHVMKLKMHRHFKTNSNITHVEHYILNCSIGDWFVLYQMSRNLNRKFFADFITVLSKRVNPDPETDCDETPFVNKWTLLKVIQTSKTNDIILKILGFTWKKECWYWFRHHFWRNR